MNLEILVSTMNKTSLDFLETMFPNETLEDLNILVVNQTQKDVVLHSNLSNIRVLNSNEKGLSKSRNLALDNALGDICLIADDDTEFVFGFQEIIKDTFKNFKDASVVKFKIETFIGKAYKTYPKKSQILNTYRDINTASSIEIAFRRRVINDKKIRFNEHFGLGSTFKSGEEFLFLRDILNNNLKIYFEDKVIVKHTSESSTVVGSDDYIKAQSVIYFISYPVSFKFHILKLLFFLYRKDLIRIREVLLKYRLAKKAIASYKEVVNHL